MTEMDLIARVKDDPLVVRVFGDDDPLLSIDRGEAALRALPGVLNRILTHGDWDFAYGTEDIDTVADQVEYTCVGSGNDKPQMIYSIKYGSSLRQLKRRSQDWMDDYETRYTLNRVEFWVRSGLTPSNEPQFKLFDTPGTAGITIRTRYLRSDLTVDDFPRAYNYVLEDGLIAALVPSYRQVYKESLAKMAGNHAHGDGSSDPMRLDPNMVRLNNDRHGEDGSFGGSRGLSYYSTDE